MATIKEYGAFVDIVPGVSGLVHISEFPEERADDPTEYVKEGDSVQIKVLEVDRMGRFKFSFKAAKSLEKKYEARELQKMNQGIEEIAVDAVDVGVGDNLLQYS